MYALIAVGRGSIAGHVFGHVYRAGHVLLDMYVWLGMSGWAYLVVYTGVCSWSCYMYCWVLLAGHVVYTGVL